MKPNIVPIGRRFFIALFVVLWGQILEANTPTEIDASSLEVLESIEAKEIFQPLVELSMPSNAVPWVGWKPSSKESLLGADFASNILVSSFLMPDSSLCMGSGEKLEIEEVGDSSAVFQGSIGGLYAEKAKKVRRAREVIAKLKQIGNFISRLTGDDMVTFPVGITEQIGNVTYTVAIGGMRLYPTHSELEVYLEIDAPNMQYPLVFGSQDIKFTKTGGIVGDARLGLMVDYFVPMFNQKAGVLLHGINDLNNNSGCYVDISCDGFEGLGLDGTVYFSREWLVPLDSNGEVIKDNCKKVAGRIQTSLAHWEEFTVSIMDLDAFAVKGLEDVKWEANNIVLDFSDVATPDSVKFPQNYASTFWADGDKISPLWKGFYMEDLVMTLPKKLTGKTTTIGARDIIIDNTGFTGKIFKSPILPLKDGKLDKWAFSIDYLEISIIQQQFEHVAFDGLIHVPIIQGKIDSLNEQIDTISVKPAECFAYGAFINPGNAYHLSVSTTEDKDYPVDMLGGWINLKEGSTIELEYVEEKFNVTAILHGDVHIDRDFGVAKLEVDTLGFDSLVVSSKAPHLSLRSIYVSNARAEMGSFSITIDDARIDSTNAVKPEFVIDASAELAKGNIALCAEGGIRIRGAFIETNGRQMWKNDKLIVEEFLLSGKNFPGVKHLSGGLAFRKGDAIYGNYFKAGVRVAFEGLDAEISAVAQFGKIDKNQENYNYFFIDAMGTFTGATVGPLIGPLELKGIGGGIYHHMEREAAESVAAKFSDPEYSTDPNNPIISMDPGVSLSGIQYLPDFESKLGLKASVVLVTPKVESAFSANLTFGIEFGTNFKIDKVYFEGNGRLMKDLKITQEPDYELADEGEVLNPNNGASIGAYVLIDYAVQQKILDASMGIYTDINGTITGTGQASLYINKSEAETLWYLKAGEPGTPNFFAIDIPIVGGAIFENYFMMGNHQIPPKLPPPPEFSDPNTNNYNGERYNVDYKFENEEGEGPKRGFIIGANLAFDVSLDAFIYVDLSAGLGFDIALLDVNGIVCADNDALGINGWYADGQAWAYFNGDVGVRAKILGKKIQVKVMELGGGMLVQAKLPNPFWAKGEVFVEYDILGGLLKGSVDFELEIGEQCTPKPDFKNVNIIESIQPNEDSGIVSIGKVPRVKFKIPVEESYTITEIGYTGTYKVKIEYMKIEANGQEVESDYELNADGMYVDIVPQSFSESTGLEYEFLPPNTDVTVTAKVSFEEWINNQWKTIKDDNGVKETDEKLVTFTTGDMPDIVLPNNVIASYPIDKQYNFYRNEHPQGGFKLNVSQNYLFNDLSNGEKIYARFTSNSAATVLQQATYDIAFKGILFDIPENALSKNKVYQLDLVVLPIGSNSSPNEQVLHSIDFRTSKYNNFKNKINNLTEDNTYTYNANEGIFPMNLNNVEPFDEFELNGGEGFGSLVQWEGILASGGNAWYHNEIKPYFYDYFPNSDYSLENRDEMPYGVPPKYTVLVNQNPTAIELTDAEIQQGSAITYSNLSMDMSYILRNVVKEDYEDIRYQIAFNVYEECYEEPDENDYYLWPADLLKIEDGTFPIEDYELPASFYQCLTGHLNNEEEGLYYETYQDIKIGLYKIRARYYPPILEDHSSQKYIVTEVE